MGYGTGKQAIARWRSAEVEVLNQICREHGIEPLPPKKARGTLEVEEYKKQRRQADELAEQNVQVEAELSEKQAEGDKLDQQIKEKTAQVKAILNYIPDYEKEFKIEDNCEQLSKELSSLLDGKLSIMKHKDDIIAKVQKLCKLVKKVNDSAYKSGGTIYALRERLDKSLKETADVRHRLKQTSGECNELRREVLALQAQVEELTEFVSILKRFEPQKYAEVKQTQEYIHTHREQEQSATKGKKSWGLE